MTHDKAACEFCQAVAVLDDATANVQMLPEFGVQSFDDAIAAVLDAIENAADVLRCWAADRESADERETEGVG
jgi:hypothetical protein